MSQTWAVSFKTNSGSFHPVRFVFDSPQPKKAARKEAEKYLESRRDFLKNIADVYAVKA